MNGALKRLSQPLAQRILRPNGMQMQSRGFAAGGALLKDLFVLQSDLLALAILVETGLNDPPTEWRPQSWLNIFYSKDVPAIMVDMCSSLSV